MAVTHIGNGTHVSNATTTTLALIAPTCIDDDILIAFIHSKSDQVVSVPSGDWTKIVEFVAGSTRITVAWKRAVLADSTATFNFTKPTDDNVLWHGIISGFRGAVKLGSPIDLTAPATQSNTSSDTVSYPDFDPTIRGHVILFGAYNNDLTTAGAVAGTNPTFANIVDVETSGGTDGSIFVYSGDSDGAAVGTRSHSTTSTDDAGSFVAVFSLIHDQTLAIDLATENDSAFDITPSLGSPITVALDLATENDSALDITVVNSNTIVALDLAVENDTALDITIVNGDTVIPLDLAVEDDTAFDITPVLAGTTVALDLAVENDIAFDITPFGPSVPIATEITLKRLHVSARYRYRFLLEFMGSSTTAGRTLTAMARWLDADEALIGSAITIFSREVLNADTPEIEVATLIPPPSARYLQIRLKKSATASTRFLIGRCEVTPFKESSTEHLARGIHIFEEFLGEGTADYEIGQYPWINFTQSGSVSLTKPSISSAVAGTWSETGVINIATSSSNGDGGGIQMGPCFMDLGPVGSEFRCKVKTLNTTQVHIWLGLWSNVTTFPDAALANNILGAGVVLRAGAGAANWHVISRNGVGNETDQDLGKPGNTTNWYDLGFIRTSDGIWPTVNGLMVGSEITTDIPGSGTVLRPVIGIISTSAASKEMQCDWYNIEVFCNRVLNH